MERYTGDITPIEFRPGCIHRPSDATSFGYEADMMMENTLWCVGLFGVGCN